MALEHQCSLVWFDLDNTAQTADSLLPLDRRTGVFFPASESQRELMKNCHMNQYRGRERKSFTSTWPKSEVQTGWAEVREGEESRSNVRLAKL